MGATKILRGVAVVSCRNSADCRRQRPPAGYVASVSVRRCSRGELPIPRQEFRDAFDRMICDAAQHVPQVGLGIDVVHLAGLKNRIHCSRAATAGIRSQEDKILPCKSQGPHCTLGSIVGHLQSPVSRVTGQCRPTRCSVTDRLRKVARATDSTQSLIEERLEFS